MLRSLVYDRRPPRYSHLPTHGSTVFTLLIGVWGWQTLYDLPGLRTSLLLQFVANAGLPCVCHDLVHVQTARLWV